MRLYGKNWKSADNEGKVTGKPTKNKWRVDWTIGFTTVVLDHGRALWKSRKEHSSAVRDNDSSLALQTSRSETEVREDIQEPSDNEKESEEDDEHSDTNPLYIKFDDDIVKWNF